MAMQGDCTECAASPMPVTPTRRITRHPLARAPILMPMEASIVTDLDTLAPDVWNGLTGTDNPFLRHEFLAGLEREGCVSPDLGWQPHHLVLRDDHGVAGCIPGYLKGHSWGEFVFDWAWADAYERNGLAYYPKLVHAVPYTPASGPRVLHRPDLTPDTLVSAAAAASCAVADRQDLSSAHWLFPETRQAQALADQDLLTRTGCQFHWQNSSDYRDFQDFLDTLTSKRRKAIRRERRQVHEAGVEMAVVPGDAVAHQDWHLFHELYRRTFEDHGNLPVLTPRFFARCGAELGDRVLMIQARREDELVAAALLLRSEDTLFGRYWGCFEEIPGLHFETCYYQGIGYCIEQGLERFEPGAQGEHKIPRGFLPTATQSCHWIADRRFRHGIADFLERERLLVDDYMERARAHSPYRAHRGSEETS